MDAHIYCSDPKSQHCSSCVNGVILKMHCMAIHTEEISCSYHTCS